MNRNNDLIREILYRVEQHNGHQPLSITVRQLIEPFPEVTQDIIDEHIRLLTEKNLLEAEATQFYWMITRLTWDGHDFLANSKDPIIWEKAKSLAGHLSWDVLTATLSKLAVDTVLSCLPS
ncbi:hypothetical protein FACS1894189_2390 [Planctomycetales bacterium]|nr:hypothetical protein FACS1894189_2390 [Planctomycetales bacterium]